MTTTKRKMDGNFKYVLELRQKEKKTINQQIEEAEVGEKELKRQLSKYDQATEILDFLYLAGYGSTHLDVLRELGVTCVINVAEECRCKFLPNDDGIVEHRQIIEDIVQTDQHSTFYQLFKVIDKVQSQGGKVLVHCMRGRSRSATIVIGYLIYKYNWDLKKAYAFVKEKRSFIGPHGHLKIQLIVFEKEHLDVDQSKKVWSS
ncbi:hypothetical protein DFA_09473 [Cavenderia fasciculata]|uniref:protein-tyrosine-phosphatase n=1 Tax=Cavenderia fasciculata TaxID=261658 RepID=F4Q7Q5_CACFS|nr:uncharacterized protein DFA_09473 [Cavenderia fasciculata]EGG15805.1 hypothetical protein DFA_09473 [Cavenderia fasciculata]|eukprot:XP_004352130.1 hypothetical protein DFA_09473 [Cavenderia fasciculata]